MTRCTWLIKPWNFEHIPSKLVKKTDLWFFCLGWCCRNTPQWCWYLHTLEMNSGLMKWLTFLLHVTKCKRISSMDVTIFFFWCKHDYKTHKMWLWQEVGDRQPQLKFQNTDNPQYLERIIIVWKRRKFTFNSKK